MYVHDTCGIIAFDVEICMCMCIKFKYNARAENNYHHYYSHIEKVNSMNLVGQPTTLQLFVYSGWQ